MSVCDIDKLRDLVQRQHYAKRRHYHPNGYGYTEGLEPVDVERQVNTYLAQGATVAALTKCVEALEAEATERVRQGRERALENERKLRVVRVCEHALLLYEHADTKTKALVKGDGYLSRRTLEADCRTLEREVKDTED